VPLPESGAYRIIASADGSAARYSFTVRSASFDQYSIKIGDTVSPDHQAHGAGIIAQPGERQSYSFEARNGQIIYFSSDQCEGSTLAFDLFNPANNVIDGRSGCGDVGPVTLPTTGIYRILAKADSGVARYTFSLRSTTFAQYSINIGDTVSSDHPGRGAGIIAQPGARQSYSFKARAGQIIYFSSDHCEGSPLAFDLFDPANNLIGGRTGCGDSGPSTLHTAGVYRIMVKADRGAARYSFSLRLYDKHR
jgi:hypothetical protein